MTPHISCPKPGDTREVIFLPLVVCQDCCSETLTADITLRFKISFTQQSCAETGSPKYTAQAPSPYHIIFTGEYSLHESDGFIPVNSITFFLRAFVAFVIAVLLIQTYCRTVDSTTQSHPNSVSSCPITLVLRRGHRLGLCFLIQSIMTFSFLVVQPSAFLKFPRFLFSVNSCWDYIITTHCSLLLAVK